MAAPPISGTKKSRELVNHFRTALPSYLDPDEPNHMIGSFQDGELTAIITMDRLTGFPYYCVGFLAVKPSRFFNPKRNGASACYAFMEKTGESLGWYRYYTHQAVGKWKDWRYTFDPEERYTVMVEEFIPANEFPQNESFWPLVGYQRWPTDMILKSVNLKPEHRPAL